MRAFWSRDAEDADTLTVKALEAYDHAFKLNPSDLGAVYAPGDLLVRRKRYEEALPYLQQAAEKNSKIALYHQKLGGLLNTLGKTEDARAEFTEALRLDPVNVPARTQLDALR